MPAKSRESCEINITDKIYYSHLVSGRKELLETHLYQTADLAACFAANFDSSAVAQEIGLLHDLGKHTEKFQKVLQGKLCHIDHAVVGAEYYWNIAAYGGKPIVDDPFIAQCICACINSHHSVLHGRLDDDAIDDRYFYAIPQYFQPAHLITDNGKENALSNQMEFEEIKSYADENRLIKILDQNNYPDTSSMSNEAKMLYVRMLFSCLVDADYSSTSAFFDGQDYAIYKRPRCVDAEDCLRRLDSYRKERGFGQDLSGMNALREQVYVCCADAGKDLAPGLFTLTAPTGTGKTLALMKFALEQVWRNHQERIFVVLPYLSIIEQNASEYRAIFGDDVCIEIDSESNLNESLRLVSERWNYPIIVTTSVAFFETLCGAKASRERKLHHLANSVVVFDEAQMLPSYLLDVTMNTLCVLPEYFKTTILLSTATQPNYHYRTALKSLPVREIIPDVDALFDAYNAARRITIRADAAQRVSYNDLLARYPDTQQLFVFNTTKKARKMYEALAGQFDPDSCFLLSSALCSDHKKKVINEIRYRLSHNFPCYVAATQCIEAGVDLDFPAGFREFAPLTSIIQTAGRVNRNGKGNGRMDIFVLDEDEKYGFPGSTYRNESYVSRNILENKTVDGIDPELISKYYKEIFSGDAEENGDSISIAEDVEKLDTKKLEEDYKLIDDNGEINIIVPYSHEIGKYNQLLARLDENDYRITKKDMREYTGLTVRVYGNKKLRTFLDRHGHVLNMCVHGHTAGLPDWYVLLDPGVYDEKRGFVTDEPEGGLLF